MSIAATFVIPGAATQPGRDEITDAVWLIALSVWAAAAVVAAAYFGVFRPRSADGPIRVDWREAAWPMLVVLVFGAAAWFGAQAAFGFVKQVQLVRELGPEARLELSMLTAADFAFLATVPPLAGFVCLLAGDLFLGAGTLRRLGFGRAQAPRGLLKGFLATLVVLPVMFWVLVGVESLYRWVGYRHPAEHDLLRMMKEAPSPVVGWVLVAGAVLFAPVFEEYLFRGHLQTVARAILVRLSTRPTSFGFTPLLPPGLQGAPVAPSAPPTLPPPLPFLELPVETPAPEPPRSHVWQTWLAILGTSVLFALVHPLWMFPPIFLLSVFLGYVYERTGNLWACIVVHALFNGTSTTIYLLQQQS